MQITTSTAWDFRPQQQVHCTLSKMKYGSDWIYQLIAFHISPGRHTQSKANRLTASVNDHCDWSSATRRLRNLGDQPGEWRNNNEGMPKAQRKFCRGRRAAVKVASCAGGCVWLRTPPSAQTSTCPTCCVAVGIYLHIVIISSFVVVVVAIAELSWSFPLRLIEDMRTIAKYSGLAACHESRPLVIYSECPFQLTKQTNRAVWVVGPETWFCKAKWKWEMAAHKRINEKQSFSGHPGSSSSQKGHISRITRLLSELGMSWADDLHRWHAIILSGWVRHGKDGGGDIARWGSQQANKLQPQYEKGREQLHRESKNIFAQSHVVVPTWGG